MRRKKRLLISGLVVMLIGGIAYLVFGHSGAGPLTISELKAEGDLSSVSQVRVAGRVAPGSIDWDPETLTTRFAITEDGESLAVLYRGALPDDFKPGAKLVVEGDYTREGVLEARALSKGSSPLCNVCH